MIHLGKLKTFLEDVSRISRNAAEITDYSVKQEEMNKKIDALTESVEKLTSHVGDLAKKVDKNTEEMTNQASRLTKIEVGL